MTAPDARRVDRPGIYSMPAELHHSDCCPTPSLSSSGAVQIMAECPARFWWNSYLNPGREPEENSAERDFGSASHVAMLEPDNWSTKVVVVEADSWRTNAAKAQRDEARKAGKVAILAEQAKRVSALSTAIKNHKLASHLLFAGATEQSIVWQDRATCVWLKGRADFIAFDQGHIVDLKTTSSAHPLAIERRAYDGGWFQQAAWYIDGLAAVTGRTVPLYFVCQEQTAPHLVTVIQMDDDAIGWGRRMNRKAIEIFARCVERNEWPGYTIPGVDMAKPVTIGFPNYAKFQLSDREAAGEFKSEPRPVAPTKAEFQHAIHAQSPIKKEVA